MDEYIEQLINKLQVPSAVRSVVQNILDEPIPEATKKRLLKPLLPRPVLRPRKRKLEKQKAVLQEFDPLHAVAWPPQFVLLKEAGMMKVFGIIHVR